MRSLTLIVGPAGVGKTTILDEVMGRIDGVRRLISMTTRSPRSGEIDGEDYHFIDRESFEAMRDQGMLVEWNVYDGEFYGTPVSDFDGEEDLVKIVTYEGMTHIRTWIDKYGNDEFFIVSLLIITNMDDLENRLRSRGCDDDKIERVRAERGDLLGRYSQGMFSGFIINDDELEEAVDHLCRWISFGQNQADMRGIQMPDTQGSEIKIREGSIPIKGNDGARHIVCESTSRPDKLHYVTVDVEDGTLLGCSCEAAGMDPTKKCKHQKAVLDQRLFQI